ncbi:MAG: hypothetical protein ABI183_09880 [Polyangiaceae bacterium]
MIPREAGVDSGTDVALPAKVTVDPSEWLTARGIPVGRQGLLDNAFDCEELVVGTSREPAIVCTVMEGVTRTVRKNTMDRMVEHRNVFVVRAPIMVKVLDVIVSIEALDKANPRAENILDLGLHFARDGLTATLDETTDHPHVRCAEARARIHDVMVNPDSLPYRDWPRFDLQLIQRACGQLGDRAWVKDQFVRAPKNSGTK